jgi:hypothetical protein
MAKATDKFGVLIRSLGFIDRYARAEPDPERSGINAWDTDDPAAIGRFKTKEAAQTHADKLAGMFNPDGRRTGYKFSVMEERMVPTWFLVEPKTEHETAPIGRYAQI